MAAFVNKFMVSMNDVITRIAFSDQALADGAVIDHAEVVTTTADALDLASLIQRLHQERAAQRGAKQ